MSHDDYGAPADPGWRAIDWSPHVHRAAVAGGSLSYVDIGEGESPPVVLIHGLGGQWRNWLENIPALAQQRRVIAPDLPGFGESDMPGEDVSVSGYARAVDALCAHLGLGPAVFVGNSMGGFVAAELAVEFPERVERLVLVDAAGMVPATRHRHRSVAVLELTGFLGARLAASYRAVAARPRLRRLALRTVAHRPDRLCADLVLEGLLAPITPAYRKALNATLGYLSWEWGERLRSVRAPTLVVWGDSDVIIPVRHGDEYCERIPDARSLVLEDTGHVPMVERPRTFNRALLEFMAEGAAAPAVAARA